MNSERRSAVIQKPQWVAISFIAGLFVFLVVVQWLIHSIQGAPFQLHVDPSREGAMIRFEMPDRHCVSPVFLTDVRMASQVVVVLNSGDVKIPGGEIEFSDTTILPGRFTLRVGSSVYDVMPSRILADGREFHWKAAAEVTPDR